MFLVTPEHLLMTFNTVRRREVGGKAYSTQPER
jgi:hypothetical protein